jgi:hypothetical protein
MPAKVRGLYTSKMLGQALLVADGGNADGPEPPEGERTDANE